METDDFYKDDFLRGLISQSPLESPSDDFVERVMANIEVVPEISPVRKPFFHYLKSVGPYFMVLLIVIFVFSTSDIPFLNWLPGKNYYLNNLVPYAGTLLASLKNAFSSKYVTLGLLITASGAFLFLIDRYLSRRTAA